jgi:quinohemoprotein amine dehydrogenase
MPARGRFISFLLPTSLLAIGLLPATSHAAWQAPSATSPKRDEPKGFVITNETVVRACSACHTRDSTGRLSRISWVRKTPEGWQESIQRMMSLNGVRLEPAIAREITRYLANRQGLAPDEFKPGRFEAERRLIDYRYTADTATENTCKVCHSLGRVITQRRTKDEWGLLLATHRGYYPDADFQSFRAFSTAGGVRHPMDKAVDHLSTVFPLETPEWAAWSATMRPPRLEGAWLLSGHEPSQGPVFGRVQVTAVAGATDEFTTEATYTYARSGRQVTRRGRAIVYTGYQWRGRSSEGGDETALREVMVVERDWREMSGRWFGGGYDELGLDVTLRRAGTGPTLLGAYPMAVRVGATNAEVRLYGSDLPTTLRPATIDFGPGVSVTEVVQVSPQGARLRISVARDAAAGRRDLFAGGVPFPGALVVYDTVHRIKVRPDAGMARVGGTVYPKQFQQFEAIGYANGPDRKPGTPDDLEVGEVEVTWGLEEYTVTYDDDDLKYVGGVDRNGFFTPAGEGPNPARSGQRNNVGDVWVVATHDPGAGQKPVRGRGHLLVTVPLYMRWTPWKLDP